MHKRRLSTKEKGVLTEKISGILKGKGYILFAYIFGSFASEDDFKDIDIGVFTQLESPAIHGGDDINKTSIPHRKGGVKATSFLTGFTSGEESRSPLKLELKLEGEIEDVIHIPVDIRIINNAPPYFIYNVLKGGIVIVDKDRSLRSDFEGLVYKKYFDFQHLRNEYLREIINAPL